MSPHSVNSPHRCLLGNNPPRPPAGTGVSHNAPGRWRRRSSRPRSRAGWDDSDHWQAACCQRRAPKELQAVGLAGVKPPGSGFGTSSKRPTQTREASGGGTCLATRRNSTCESWEGPPIMLGTISPSRVGRGQKLWSRVWPEVSTGCSKHAQLSSAGCRPDAQLQWGPTSGAPGGSSAEGGPGHSSGRLTIMTSKCRRPES